MNKRLLSMILIGVLLFTMLGFAIFYSDIGEFLSLSRSMQDGLTRSMQASASQFEVNGCGVGTVLDTVTNICWQRNWSGYLSVDGDGVNWTQGAGYCDDLTLGEKTEWTLPNIKEFRRLIPEHLYNYYNNVANDYIEDFGFQDTGLGGLYWSGTERTVGSTAWYVTLDTGYDDYTAQGTDTLRAVCSVWND